MKTHSVSIAQPSGLQRACPRVTDTLPWLRSYHHHGPPRNSDPQPASGTVSPCSRSLCLHKNTAGQICATSQSLPPLCAEFQVTNKTIEAGPWLCQGHYKIFFLKIIIPQQKAETKGFFRRLRDGCTEIYMYFWMRKRKKRLQNMWSVTNQFYSHFTHTNIKTSADERYDRSNLIKAAKYIYLFSSMINFPLGKHPPTTNF